MQSKLELTMREVGCHTILTGVLLSQDFKAENLSAMEMSAHIRSDGSVLMSISKNTYEPKDEFNTTFEKHGLSELTRESIWRGYQSDDPNHIGGVVVGRENLLFDTECPEIVTRTALISVIETTNLLNGTDHGVLRSVHFEESDVAYTFLLEPDTSPETLELTASLRGDGLMSFYRKPFWTLADGTAYRLTGDQPLINNQLFKKQIQDFIQYGELTAATRQEMRDNLLNINEDSEFVDFAIALNNACPFSQERYDRLLTEKEVELIDTEAKRYLRAQMGQ